MTNSETTESRPPSGGRSLRQLATTGAAWALLTYGGTHALRLGSNLVLTRLLFEEAFGLMALTSVFLTGLQLFSDIGIGPSVVQNKEGDRREFLDTAWTLQIGRGAILWLLGSAGAIPFSRFYGEPELVRLIPAVATTALIAGFNSTKLFTAQRHLGIKPLALLDVGSNLIGIVTMIVWAFISPTIWALVSGGIVTSIVKLTLSHVALPGENNRIRWDERSARELIRFGRWLFLSTALTFFVSHSDRLIFGKMIPVSLLGVYSIGATLARFPRQALSEVGSKILFPVCSRVENEGGDMPSVFAKMRWPLLAAGGWMLAGFMGGGQTIIDILYDNRYAQAGWMLQVISMANWFYVLQSTGGAPILSQGRAYFIVLANVGRLIGIIAFTMIGYDSYGFPGALFGYSASEIARYLLLGTALSRMGVNVFKMDALLTLLVGISATAGYWGANWARAAGLHIVVEAGVVFVLVSAVWAPIGWPYLAKRLRARG